MKYMGSKRAMLKNGLGEMLRVEMCGINRFFDLFAGSGAVSIHVARQFSVPVFAFDLQHYSIVLTNAVVNREQALDWKREWKNWRRRAEASVQRTTAPSAAKLTQPLVDDFRDWCALRLELPITRAYGGHYFSPQQSVWIDALRFALPRDEPAHTVALAALIQAASKCAAAPGHTAQPFQPTRTAKRFLQESWNKDVVAHTRATFEAIASLFAMNCGKAVVGDANEAAQLLKKGDLAFVDPPYSGVHYSRFYHVLESIARGAAGDVTGVGRYPSREHRPRSKYSLKTDSSKALEALLEIIAQRGAKAIVTFPDHDCSNGLSGDIVRRIAESHFLVGEKSIESKFSTLGGTSAPSGDEGGRAARKPANELMLLLEPRAHLRKVAPD